MKIAMAKKAGPKWSAWATRARAIAEVHDGIAAFLEARGFSSLADLPRYLPRD